MWACQSFSKRVIRRSLVLGLWSLVSVLRLEDRRWLDQGRPKSQDRRAKAKDLHSMIRMPHIDNFRYRFRNEFTNLCCVRDVAASALGDVRGAISSFKNMLDSQFYMRAFLFEWRGVSQ